MSLRASSSATAHPITPPPTITTSAAAGARLIAETLGLALNTERAEVPDDVAALVTARTEARAAKDYAKADEIRDQLTALGWTVEDSADGPVARPIG